MTLPRLLFATKHLLDVHFHAVAHSHVARRHAGRTWPDPFAILGDFRLPTSGGRRRINPCISFRAVSRIASEFGHRMRGHPSFAHLAGGIDGNSVAAAV